MDFDAIYRDNVEFIYRIAYARLGDEPQAQDATQETFLRALRDLDRFDEKRGSVRMWLCGIVSNVCFGSLRYSGRLEQLVPDIRAAEGLVDEAVMNRLEVDRLLSMLSPEDALLVRLRVWLELSNEEIGVLFGISPAASMRRLSRALAQLRRL